MALKTFSYFDTGKNASFSELERFYHGFVLGLLVELNGQYVVTSNRESGFGRYDVMLEPLKQYETQLLAKGILAEKIRKYGFAFEGKTVLIG